MHFVESKAHKCFLFIYSLTFTWLLSLLAMPQNCVGLWHGPGRDFWYVNTAAEPDVRQHIQESATVECKRANRELQNTFQFGVKTQNDNFLLKR